MNSKHDKDYSFKFGTKNESWKTVTGIFGTVLKVGDESIMGWNLDLSMSFASSHANLS